MKFISYLIMLALVTKARALSDLAVYIPALSDAAHAAHEQVRDADLARRKAVWTKVAPQWDHQDVYNGHPIAWGRRDANLEAALADEEAVAYIARLDRQLAEWDAANQQDSRLGWEDCQHLREAPGSLN